ncbi:hypothetical protein RGQ15_05330 [Paracoccus sp. MBLB3053]|uniref:Integrase catalytic domain-containing protein n=1 Tax=Paracoccus aurantius TaxID=3073814 RepID=A0ABU2HPL2_9RHOB|nr:hypothetical protein [Paracoccus sp. MBLB3053]MDS9466998.1 hypothetical protein [Paracoccus sp. MBLB3053]
MGQVRHGSATTTHAIRAARQRSEPHVFFHVDLAEVQTAEGKHHLFVANDRSSKFAFVRLVRETGKLASAQFLRDLIAAVPYPIHTVPTDNDMQFANRRVDPSAYGTSSGAHAVNTAQISG